mmetsp:Transcript_63145/g.145286  ORF Transcript_63145/g.145286 Transcript_63145/m.145286 type:complete len:542 (+) Transcript_63145:15-1640(+)
MTGVLREPDSLGSDPSGVAYPDKVSGGSVDAVSPFDESCTTPDAPVSKRRRVSNDVASPLVGKVKREKFVSHLPGALSSSYDARGVLGDGINGDVFKCIEKATGAARAVKQIRMSSDEVKRTRLERELDILKKADNPGIVRLYHTMQDSKFMYLIMEALQGGDVLQRWESRQNQPYSEAEARSIIRQVLGALAYLHARNIAHRDLKPENLVFVSQKEDALKIVDFGLSAKFSPDVELTDKVGTKFYMAPEVVTGDHKHDNKCDLWSVGVILFMLLSGQLPFGGRKTEDVYRAIAQGNVVFKPRKWDGVNPGPKDFIMHLLVERSMRPTATQALSHQWLQDPNYEETKVDKAIFLSIIGNFRRYRRQGHLKKLARTVVATRLERDELKELETTFRVLDSDNTGTLTCEKMKRGLQKHLGSVPGDFDQIFRDVDSDGSGEMEFTEFIAAAMKSQQYRLQQACWESFRTFDKHRSGRISVEDFKAVLQDLRSKDISSAEIDRLFSEADRNGDRTVDFDDWMAMMNGAKDGLPFSQSQTQDGIVF